MILESRNPLWRKGEPWVLIGNSESLYYYGSIPDLADSHVYVYIKEGFIIAAGLSKKVRHIEMLEHGREPNHVDIAYWREEHDTFWYCDISPDLFGTSRWDYIL